MFDKREAELRGGSSYESGASVGQQQTSGELSRDHTVPFSRSLSCSASSNESETLNKNSMSNSNSYVDCAPTSPKSSVVVDQSRKMSGEATKEEKRDVKRRLWSEQVTRSRWNDLRDGETGRSGRRRRRNVNCLLYTSPSPRDGLLSRMPSSA